MYDCDSAGVKNKSSVLNSQESVDLNNLNDLIYYNDFNKSDLIKDDLSSSSSYCEIIDNSDAEFDKNFSCVHLNINLDKNVQKKSTWELKLSLNSEHKFINKELNNSTIDKSSNIANSSCNFNKANKRELDSDQSSVKKKKLNSFVVKPSVNTIDELYEYPWICENNIEFEYRPGILGLHDEIEDFYQFSKLKPEEIQVRNQVFTKVKEVIRSRWPGAKVFLFGSFQTNLSLPFSDLDVVIFNYVNKIPFIFLENKLIKEGLTTSDNVKIIDKANVPIIKFIHTETGINVDLGFNCADGPKAIKFIQNYIEKYPALPKLLLIVKLFLHQRKLNFSYTGGLSSYSITLMMIAFFKQQNRQKVLIEDKQNLGVLLIEFFEFFGIGFNHKLLGISVRNNHCLVQKFLLDCLDRHEIKRSRLCIEDPMDRTNNPCRNAHQYDKIRKSFENAFMLLHKNCRLKLLNTKCTGSKSILSQIVGYTRDQLQIREKVLKFHYDKIESVRPINDENLFELNGDFIALSKTIPDEVINYDY